jgi:A1 cistron-splicing factor AAR2
MAPYPFDEGEDYERWMSLCYAITPKDVELFLPKRDHVFTSMSCSILESEDVAPLRFSDFDLKRSFPPNAVGEERSKYSRDKTYLLKSVLKSLGYDCQRLIAEFQFAFIALVFMQNFDGFEQWKRILHLVCHSGEFVSENQQFYVEFINALEFQLLNVPEEFFDAEILTESNFMDDALEELFREVIIDNCCEGPGLLLVDRLTRFNEFISSRFKRNILEAARKEES